MYCSFGLSRQLCPVLLCAITISLCGCSQDDGIRQYTVEKMAPREKKPMAAPLRGNAEPAWFFKLTGPADAVLKEIVPFSKILQTLHFDASGNPLYEFPDDWTITAGPPPRYQTVRIGETEPPLEVTVSSLPGPSSAFDRYLLSNINRWRGQLALKPYDESDWIEKARSSGELIIIPQKARIVGMVNLLGETQESGKTRMLAAVVLSPPGASESSSNTESGEAAPKTPVTTRQPPFDFELPEGWKKSAGNAMRLGSFEAPHEAGAADISVSRFPGGGDVISNVNRWRQQVKLEPLKEEQLKSHLKEMKIGGKPASYMTAEGKEQSILAAIVPDGDAKWFFKMQGPTASVKAEKTHFEEFLKSVKFEE